MVKLNIIEGSAGVDLCYLRVDYPTIVVLHLEMTTKYNQISLTFKDSYGVPGVFIKTDISNIQQKETSVSFPEYKGWSVIAHSSEKYHLTIVLQKD